MPKKAVLFRVEVHPDSSEPFVVDVTTRDGLQWEGARRGRSIKQFEENPSFADLYELSFFAVMRSGKFNGDINDYKRECDLDRLPLEEDDEVDPTQPAR